MERSGAHPRGSGGWLLAAGVAGAGVLGWRLLQRVRETNLEGEVVLITGGSRGLGLLLARELSKEGCRLVLCARDPAELNAATEELTAGGAEVLALRCDVSRRDEVAWMVSRANERFGRIDAVINNAGIILAAPVGALSIEDFRDAMDAVYWGTVYTTLEVLPQMRERGRGRIVNITSIGGMVAIPHLLPYGAAKFATVGLSEGLRAELARFGVTVTTVVPGLMRTGSPVNAYFKGDPEKEFGWFAAASATPLTTMSAERAARRIVRALRRGEAHVTLSWQARVLRLAHDLLPGLTADALGVVNRVLPTGEEVREKVKARDLHGSSLPSFVKAGMRRAARRSRQYAGGFEPRRVAPSRVDALDTSATVGTGRGGDAER